MTGKPTVRVRRETETAWEAHKGTDDFPLATDIDAAWSQIGANEVTNSVTVDDLPLEFTMPTSELEEIVALGQPGTSEYEAAQKALLARPAEYQPGKSEGKRYQGSGVPRFEGGR